MGHFEPVLGVWARILAYFWGSGWSGSGFGIEVFWAHFGPGLEGRGMGFGHLLLYEAVLDLGHLRRSEPGFRTLEGSDPVFGSFGPISWESGPGVGQFWVLGLEFVMKM